MKLTILKRERSVREIPLACLFAATLSALLLGLGTGLPRIDAGASSALDASRLQLALVSVVLLVAIILAVRGWSLQTRWLDFDRTLPINTRSVAAQRAAATWLALVLPFLAASAAIAVRATDRQDLLVIGAVVARGLSALTLGVLILYAYRPRRLRLHSVELIALCTVGVGVAWSPIFLQSASLPVVTSILSVSCVGLLWIRLRDWSPVDDPRVTAPANEEVASPLPVRVFGPLRWTLMRSTFLRPDAAGWVVVIVAMAVFMPSEILIFFLYMPVLAVFSCMLMGLNLLHGTDAFPMRRRRLLPFIAVPSLLMLMVGAGVLAARPTSQGSGGILSREVSLDRQSDSRMGAELAREHHVRVPPDLWRLAFSAEEARIVAPWGETADPQQHPVFVGTSTFAYNPFDVRATSSGRFLMWQISRALSEVHDFRGTPDDVHARWFPGVDLNRPIGGLRFAELDAQLWGFPPPESARTPNAVGLAVLLAMLIWWLVAAFMLRPNVPSRSGSRPRGGRPNALAAGAFFGLSAGLAAIIQKSDPALLGVLMTRLHTAIDGALSSSPLLWTTLILALFGAGYAFLVRRIERIEVPPLARNNLSKRTLPIY